MERNFDRSLTLVLKHEGGYVDHPRDPGGATNLGITIGTAKALGIDIDGDGDTDKVDIRLLKPADAAKVYGAQYWNRVRGDDLPSGVDYAVFDFAVNSGVSRAAIFLQEIVGVAPDGEIGPLTLAALKQRDSARLIDELCAKRMTFLKKLSTWPTFGKGWSSRVSGVLRAAKAMAVSPVPPVPDKPTYPEPATSNPATKPTAARKGIPGWVYFVAIAVAVVIGLALFTPIF